MAGLTTFFAMAYIIVVNPSILSQTGMEWGAVFLATIISSIIGTLVMGLVANVPYAQAPGMGLNAFFVYTVCFALKFTWQQALSMVFICGVINIIITVTTVSYTHLDVYKRQGKSHDRRPVLIVMKNRNIAALLKPALNLKTARRRNILEIDPAETAGNIVDRINNLIYILRFDTEREGIDTAKSLEPVSYTHLDVYKRQLSYCSINPSSIFSC